MSRVGELEPLYTTGDIARLTGNTLRTVRYYEELGLLTPVPRREGGHRQFTALDLDRLRTITDMRAVGLTLEQAAEVLNLRMRGPDRMAQSEKARQLIDEQLVILRERIATLTRVEQQLSHARDVLQQCKDCPTTVGTHCSDCTVVKRVVPNPLVNVLLSAPVTTERDRQNV